MSNGRRSESGATVGRHGGRGGAGWLLALCIGASLLVVVYPAWVVRPFRAQDTGELDAALRIVRLAPVVTAAMLFAGVLAALLLRPRGWRRGTAAVGGVALLVLAAIVARVDYFELMFRPDPRPRFVAAAKSGFTADDMVLVAHAGGEAHAYPVRMMAYHHLVNDTVGGVPIVATY